MATSKLLAQVRNESAEDLKDLIMLIGAIKF
jgi:hypothetical protein